MEITSEDASAGCVLSHAGRSRASSATAEKSMPLRVRDTTTTCGATWSTVHAWDRWILGMQDLGDCAAVLFAIRMQKRFGYQRLAMAFVRDDDGSIVFESAGTSESVSLF